MTSGCKSYGWIIGAVVTMLTMSECSQPTGADGPTTHQGVYGYVRFWEGNFMPKVTPVLSRGTITTVERTIVVHTPTRTDSVIQALPAFYSAILTPRVAATSSNASGFFQVELPPGSYSLFVVEDTLFYANGLDAEGHLWPVTVTANSFTYVELNIVYRATF